MEAIDGWPSYPIGPRKSIFAMGVVSIKFAELESVIIFMLATVTGSSVDAATKIASKIGTASCQYFARQMLPRHEWSEQANELVEHFFKGVAVLTDNRNHLMHSNLAWTASEHTVLFKTSKRGNTVMAVPRLNELQQVADDMEAFISFGRQLANAINNESSAIPIFPKSAFPWPNKPATPSALVFTPGPHPLPKDGS
jgi:hypothetical protein